MLDTKIKFIIENIDSSRTKLIKKYIQKLDMYGKQDPTAGIYLEMLISALALSQESADLKIQHNLTLALYQKLNTLLKNNGLMFKIPDIPAPPPVVVLPFYYGVEDKNLDASLIPTILQSDGPQFSDRSLQFSPNMQVLYFAYPVKYGNLDMIQDANMYNITPGWLARTDSIVVGGSLHDYIIYEFKNYTTQVDFTIHFKFPTP